MISDKIAVIDDDVRVIKSLKMVLAEYDIVEFADCDKAVSFFRKSRDINVILLDVMMPGIGGLKVLKEIRKKNKDVAIIIMTAFATKDVAVKALISKANDFIEKPFDMDMLKSRIRAFLKERSCSNRELSDKDYKIERIKNFVRRNCNIASLEAIAEEMCLSSKHISRMFKAQTGQSFREFHIGLRMDSAKDMLKNTSFNVEEIAYKLGYQNPESFMRIFKERFKKTPTQYREKYS